MIAVLHRHMHGWSIHSDWFAWSSPELDEKFIAQKVRLTIRWRKIAMELSLDRKRWKAMHRMFNCLDQISFIECLSAVFLKPFETI